MNIKKYEKLLKQKAYSFASWFGCSPCSLEDELRDLFTNATQSYKEGKGASFPTWLNRIIYNGMMDYIKEQNRYSKLISEAVQDGEPECFDNERRAIFLSELEKLSGSSQFIVQELFNGNLPIECPGQYKTEKGVIREYLLEQGWKACDIAFSFKEIRMTLKRMV